HVLLEIRGGNPATEAATVPGPTRVEAAEVALQTLLARPANSPTDREGLRRGLADFCCNFAGTPQAVRAAGLCRQFRSLLDNRDPQQIPRDERFPWQPKELVAVLGEHRQRHWGAVNGVAFSPDGQRVASCGRDRVVRVWDTATGKEQAVLRPHSGPVFN